MEFKNVMLILFISLILLAPVCAQKNVSDFEVDKSYKHIYDDKDYYSLYINDKQDAGVIVFKNVDDDAYDDDNDDDDAYDHLIHDDAKEYTTPDDDFKIDKNSDNTTNFTDVDHTEKGVVEVIKCDGQEYVVVFWAKDDSNVTMDDLTSLLHEFNKDNKVEAISF